MNMMHDDLAFDDFVFSATHEGRSDAEEIRITLYLGMVVIISWIMGGAKFSVVWAILILALAMKTIKEKVSWYLERKLQHERILLRRRQALEKGETAEWISLLLSKWWRFSASGVFKLAKEYLEIVFDELKPSILGPVEVRQFTLGKQTPCITRVQVLDRCSNDDFLIRDYNNQAKLSIAADIQLDCEEFLLLVTTRFGKGVGMDIDLAVENLMLSGTIVINVILNELAPFPHVTDLSMTFLEKPNIWFDVKILGAVQVMEMPLIKTWIHTVVTDALSSWLVDSGQLEMNLRTRERPGPKLELVTNPTPQGVLTVAFNPIGCFVTDEKRWLVVTVGDQKHIISNLNSAWTEDLSFLVGALDNEKIVVKLKTKWLLSTVTLAQFELALGIFDWENSHIVKTTLQQTKLSRSSANFPNISAKLEYTGLPLLDPDLPLPETTDNSHLAGVLMVYIHSANNLSSDSAHCNPYCILFNNQKKIKTTHYVRSTTSPVWDCKMEFLVQNYTEVSLSFVIFSWNVANSVDTNTLGLATLSLSQDMTCIVKKELTLNSTLSSILTVSVLFYPVKSVQQTFGNPRSSVTPTTDDESKMKWNIPSEIHEALLLPSKTADPSSDISSLLSTESSLMEVTLLCAKDLHGSRSFARNNTFINFFYELKVNNETKYKSNMKKKTLIPCWNESSIMGLPKTGETLDIVLWDHDTFVKEYLGKVSLTLDDIRRLSNSDHSHWFQLKETKMGSVELKIKILSEECETQSTCATSIVSDNSSHLNTEPDSESSIVRRMEKSMLNMHLNPVIPPPPPPRTITLLKPTTSNQSDKANINKESNEVNGTSKYWIPEIINESVVDNSVDESDTAIIIADRQSSHHSLTLSPDQSFGKKVPQYSSFRIMKQKVKKGLGLRRFRSEVTIENKNDSKDMTLSLEPRGGGEADATELLSEAGLAHAVSQPDMLDKIKHSSPRRILKPNDLKIVNGTKEKYSGVEGKVIQAQGLHVAHIAQLYCQVKLQTCSSPSKIKASPSSVKTIAKSRLLPAMPNPQFGINFRIDCNSVPRQAFLIFDIKSASKELLASRRITLHELLGVSPASNEIHTWLALNNGASLEVQIIRGKEFKNKSAKKLFRSWSVHRIGKI
ncbi:uncharacterized protein LOC109858995 isoform X2 [Pseudomyrmex gracilis]|uniref:uncharacterized protein LOC109858995 isoform X2 n=1 Tax=Pseudomyrmex gracilis TaxID=219809 RepID=UPI00099597F2|nr:uncharacterized protein LOC109858995 isoform X2 [Pseudomyrmex gracilis]